MLQHALLWSYASVWKPRPRPCRDDVAVEAGAAVDPEARPEAAAFVGLMRRVRCGAAPAWWATTEGVGHG